MISSLATTGSTMLLTRDILKGLENFVNIPKQLVHLLKLTINKKQHLLKDLRNIESNIVKKGEEF